jgi:4-hydroxybenzoate polyprenyltransferase
MQFRTERDPLGEFQVPADAYYGVQTARAASNFRISELRAPADLIVATVLVKRAAAEANVALGRLDAGVERTCNRPLPSGRVTIGAAVAFLVVLALIGLAVLLSFNKFSVRLGIASLGVVAVYPLMKRVTSWPQAALGLGFSWGALMGWSATFASLSVAPILLYASAFAWTIGYDTIYALQDARDDAIVGIRSTARLFEPG